MASRPEANSPFYWKDDRIFMVRLERMNRSNQERFGQFLERNRRCLVSSDQWGRESEASVFITRNGFDPRIYWGDSFLDRLREWMREYQTRDRREFYILGGYQVTYHISFDPLTGKRKTDISTAHTSTSMPHQDPWVEPPVMHSNRATIERHIQRATSIAASIKRRGTHTDISQSLLSTLNAPSTDATSIITPDYLPRNANRASRAEWARYRGWGF